MTRESWKSQTWWMLPVYTGDVSGVCSALYELGGMVVMHDPSGCNSTYNTHDEIRWTRSESLIFLSGLTQMDAITGNDKRLIGDIVSAAKEYRPQFIAIANSPVPWLIGTDFSAICSKVCQETGIPAFHVETNAMHDYTRGAGQAFLKLAQMLFGKDAGDVRLSGSRCPGKIRVNVLGMTPLDFTAPGETRRIRAVLKARGFETVSVWAMGDGEDSLSHIRKSLDADVNLVVSSSGIDAARWMEEMFRIPYTVGIPCGLYADVLFDSLSKAAREKKSSVPYLKILNKHVNGAKNGCNTKETFTEGNLIKGRTAERCIASEAVTAGSLAADRILRDGRACDMVPLTETVKGLILENCLCPKGERQIREVLGSYEEVIADPMLKEACQNGCRFEELPHFALSGRLFLNRIRPLINTGYT